jgi:hypothetical protein
MDRYKNPLTILVQCTNRLYKKTGYGGFCVWEDEAHRPRSFNIEIDADASRQTTIQALIHEMVHVKQFASGRLQDLVRHYHIKKWKAQRVNSANMSYWDYPWEQEAYTYERRYWIEYEDILKKNKKKKVQKHTLV